MAPAMKGTKRAAKAKADPAEKRRCAEVAKGLKDSDLPKDALLMLATMAEPALLEFRECRHKFQDKVVAMAGDALASTEAGFESAAAKAKAAHADAVESKANIETSLDEKRAQVDAAAEAMEKKKRALAEVARSYQAAKTAVVQATAARDDRARRAKATVSEKELLQATAEEKFRPLVEGMYDVSCREELIERLTKVLSSFAFDTSIVVTLPSVFGKATTDRGSFDTMVISNLNEEFTRRLAACDEALHRDHQEVAAEEAADATRSQQVTSLQEQQIMAAEAFMTSQSAHAAAEEATTEAKRALKEQQKQAQRCKTEVAKLEVRLEKFRTVPLAAFLELRDREAPAGEEEEKEEQKEAPAGERADTAEAGEGATAPLLE